MALLFISHSSADDDVASSLRHAPLEREVRSMFLDFDPQDGIPAGRDWKRELYAQLRQADAVIFLGSAASSTSYWCFAKLALAQSIDKPIFPIAIDGTSRHSLLAGQTVSGSSVGRGTASECPPIRVIGRVAPTG